MSGLFTNSDRIILAHEAGEWLTVAEAVALNKLLDALRNQTLRIIIAEQVCEATGYYQDADEASLDQTGRVLRRCALIATGKGN